MKSIIGIIAALLLGNVSMCLAGNTWSDAERLAGNWAGGGFKHKFKCATQIELELWPSAESGLEGAALFKKKDQFCLGKVAVTEDNLRLVFTGMDGSLCDCSDKGAFTIHRFIEKQNRLALAFEQHNSPNIFVDRLNTTRYYVRPKNVSDTLADFVNLLKQPGKSYAQKKQKRVDRQGAAIRKARDAVANARNFSFFDGELIGVWKGTFVTQDATYPAEMMFWSSTPYRLNQIVGMVRFEGDSNKKPLCVTGIMIPPRGEHRRIQINSSNLGARGKACEQADGNGFISLGSDGDSLSLFLNSKVVRYSRTPESFFDNSGLPDQGDGCFAVGMFRRGKASAKLKKELRQIHWKLVKAPTVAEKAILLGDGSRIGELKQAHAGAMSENAGTLAQIDAEKKAFKEKQRKKEEQRIAALREKRRAEAERKRRRKAEWDRRQRDGGSGGVHAPEIPLPVVSGPFDGLPGGSFINAVYIGDFDAVATFNESYGNRKIRQYKRSMGNKPHFMDGVIIAAYQTIQLQKIMAAVYLFNYDSKYEACLRDDAVTFEVVEHVPDTVYRNLLGWEVMRSYGYTSREKFRVNKEFTAAFRLIGRTKPDSAMGTIADYFLNQGGTDIKREMVKGTRAMMQKFSCDSQEIRQFEQNLLQLMP